MESKKTQLQTYLAHKMVNFIEPMLAQALKKRPEDSVDFCIKWLQKYQQNRKQQSNSDTQDQNEVVPDLTIIKKRKLLAGKKQSRMAISEEVFGQFNKKSAFAPKQNKKSEQSKILILSLIRNSILFHNLDQQDEQTLIDAMGEQHCDQGQVIIREGAAGDLLYIVQSGQYDCFKNINGNETYLKTYKYGESFGELALMYNAPRAATIKVKQSGKLFTLDRITFSHIIKNAASKKRDLFSNVFNKIELFAQLNQSQKEKFFDALKEEKYQQGQYVVEQGGSGDKFYIILEGKLVAQRYQRCSLQPKIVYHYREGDYFGQLALLHNVDRQANVKALTAVRLASIGRQSFMRLLGSLKDILQRNQKKYTKYQQRSSSMLC